MTDEQNQEVTPLEEEVPQPEEAKTEKTLDEIVAEVIDGKWGDSSAVRRQRLSEAGYDHVAVLKAVVRRGNHLS